MLGHTLNSHFSHAIFAVAVASILSGCGGSSGSSESGSAVEVSPPPPPTDVTVGANYFYRPKVEDGTGPVVYSISSTPKWATFDPSTGTLSGAPSDSDVGDSGDIAITVTVQADSASGAAQEDQTTAASATAVAATSSSSSSGTSADSSGTRDNLRARFGSIGPFRIRVHGPSSPANPSDEPPTISGTPAVTDTAGQAYSFTPTASDPDGNSLLFSIVNKPSWAKFDTNTGALSGTPAATDVGTTSKVVISVTDGTDTVSLPAFAIQVTALAGSGTITRPPVNAAPTITGSPVTTVAAGSAYSFTPVAKDSDSTTLTFSIQNKPAWATFNTATGQLLGTPAAASVGSYPGVVIAVTDGQSSVSLAAFTVNVTGNKTNTTTLSWVAPTQNTDGSALTDLSGYRIYYGTSASSMTQTITVSTATVLSYEINNLATGTWYFAVKSFDTSNVESDLSGVVSAPIS